MDSRIYCIGLVSFVLASAACDSDDPKPDPLAAKNRAFATYNVGLATGYVDYAAERRPQIVTLIAGLDVDVLCLNEVWTQSDVDAIAAGTSTAFPYSHYQMLEDKTLGPTACNVEESDTLLACVDDQCAGVPSSEIAGCVLSKCRPQFDALQPSCGSCLAANIGKEVAEIIQLCRTAAPRFTYDGANGLMVLSRAPITNPKHEKIDSSLVQRSVLGVTVELPKLGTVAFACTHIAADLGKEGVPYTGPYESFEGENIFQAGKVRDFMNSYGAGADLKVLVGDMNSGPEFAPGVTAEIPEAAFKVFADAGYVDFPSSLGAPSGAVCTFCADNALIEDTHPNVQIDHILFGAALTGWTPTLTRIGTETISITLEDGSAVTTNPSDHYGVRLGLDAAP